MKCTIEKVCHSMIAANDVKAVIIVGSQARKDFGADEYSDLDIIIISSNPEFYLTSQDWLKDISDFYISFIENTLFNAKERRVLFNDGTDVDFIILSIQQSEAIQINEKHSVIFQRGFNIIKDEINFTGILTAMQKYFRSPKQIKPLSQMDFNNEVNDFWFHSVWTSKKIMRGELLTAKSCLDNYMKSIVLTFIEHYIQIKDNTCDVWYNGRFIEKWADDWIIEKLSHSYASYNKIDMIEALYTTMELFAELAVNIAKQYSYVYPKYSQIQAYQIVSKLLAK